MFVPISLFSFSLTFLPFWAFLTSHYQAEKCAMAESTFCVTSEYPSLSIDLVSIKQ